MKQSELKILVHYCEDTGIVSWKARDFGPGWWNSRYAGRPVGAKDAEGYLITSVKGRVIKLHRLIWIYVHGDIPEGIEIDHINGDRQDNRLSNLRLATDQQNAVNAGVRIDNKSGYKGISWHKRIGKWQAQINISGKRVSLGYFNDPKTASNAYRERAQAIHGEYARL